MQALNAPAVRYFGLDWENRVQPSPRNRGSGSPRSGPVTGRRSENLIESFPHRSVEVEGGDRVPVELHIDQCLIETQRRAAGGEAENGVGLFAQQSGDDPGGDTGRFLSGRSDE